MMLKLAQEGDLFAGRVPEQLHGPHWPFDASFVARIHGDETHDLRVTADLVHEAFGYHPDTLPYGARANVRVFAFMRFPVWRVRAASPAWQSLRWQGT